MEQNIREICNINCGNQNNIVSARCSNFTHNSTHSFSYMKHNKCSGCSNYVCQTCANANFDRCIMCYFNGEEEKSNRTCVICKNKKTMYCLCCKCLDIVQCCGFRCTNNNMGRLVPKYMVLCKNCQ